MAEKYSIGLDYGSLSGRAVLIRISDGKCMADAVMDYPHAVMDKYIPTSDERLPADFALQHPQDYIDVLNYDIKSILEQSGVDPEDIVSIGIDFTCCTMLPVDKDGMPLCFKDEFKANPYAYVKLWKHHAAQQYADKINETALARGEKFMADYGNKISSEWMFPKIWETLDKAPEVYESAAAFMEAGDFIARYLTGVYKKSYTYAAVKAIYSKERGYPSHDFLASLDERLRYVVEEKMNAPIISSTEPYGKVCARASRELGLSENTVVGCPHPDAHVATAALHMDRVGDMCMVMGTSSCFMMLQDSDITLQGVCGRLPDVLTPGFWGHEAGLCCVGDHFAWVADKLAPPEYREAAEKEGKPLIKYMVELAFRKAPGAHGLVALDWWNGNRCLLVDSQLTGMILGMTLQTTSEDILRALIEATAYGTRMIIDNYDNNGLPIKRLIAAGGIARKDPYTMQLYADVLGREIIVSSSTQAPALASSIYAAAAAGYDFKECMDNMGSEFIATYTPNPESREVYEKLYREYVTLHDYFGRGENNVMKRLRAIKEAQS